MKRLNLLVLILSFALVWPQPLTLWAAPVTKVGVMTINKGSVKVRRDKKDIIYKKPGQKVDLYNGDSLQSGANSEAQVLITAKGDEITLFSNSFLGVEDGSGE